MVEQIEIFNEIIMRMVNGVLWISPVGIGSLIAAKLAGSCDPGAMVDALGLFIFNILLGLGIQAFVVLPLIFFGTTGFFSLLRFERGAGHSLTHSCVCVCACVWCGRPKSVAIPEEQRRGLGDGLWDRFLNRYPPCDYEMPGEESMCWLVTIHTQVLTPSFLLVVPVLPRRSKRTASLQTSSNSSLPSAPPST